MFKSLFSKYITAFMLIVVLSFLVVVVITASMIGRYSANEKQEMMQASVDASRIYLEDRLENIQGGLEELLDRDGADVSKTLGLLSRATGDVSLVLTDVDGRILLDLGEDADFVLEPDILNELQQSGQYVGGVSVKWNPSVKTVNALPVESSDGSVCGYVLVYSDSLLMERLFEVIVRVIMGSIIWVLLAALIAVYFISERVIAPMREISSAAKHFASGRFDTRVPVRGSDEVAELAVAFNNMAESLDNYDNMRNKFMSDVSHDLRSPMTSISGFIDGIIDGVIPPDKHEYYLKIVSEEIKRLSRLVATLLDLSRIQAGERKFTMAEFDICEMARQILISFEQKINSKELDVSFDIEEERMNVNADRDAIYQVLYNLCDNAVKFSCERGKLSISVKRIKGKRIQIDVYNEGSGISEEDINYVFERFYKSDKSRGLNKSGAGLGLFISKTIMEAHGQKIWVDSDYGKNCCFSFTLDAE